MFEEIGTIMNNINLFGMGTYIAIAGLIFAIARGISSGNKEQMMIWGVTLGMFGTLLLFSDDYIKGILALTTVILMVLYGISKLGVTPRKGEE